MLSPRTGPVPLDLRAIRGNSSFASYLELTIQHFGGRHVRRGGLAIIVAMCLALAGCSLFGKKKPDAEQPPPPAPPPSTANNNTTGNAKGSAFSTTSNPKTPLPGASGMLAGRVICSYDRQPPPTIIQYVPTGEKSSDGKAPEISTDGQGYFVIQGLVPGQGYQLTARTRDGDVKMGGVSFAIAPNPRVLIPISEEFAVPSPPKKNNDKSTGANDTSSGDLPDRPARISGPVGSTAELTPAGGESAGNANGKEFASRDQADRERIPLNIGAGGRGPPQSAADDYGGGVPPVAARVPSCVKTGRQGGELRFSTT